MSISGNNKPDLQKLSSRLWPGMFALLITIWLCAACSPAITPAPTETIPPTLPATTGKAGIEGIVVGGGDKSPTNRSGGPRTFIFEVRIDSGEIVLVTYVALPPSPAADQQRFRLDFHAGEIKIGDYLKAYGSFDPATLTLTVAEQGDYIETYPTKP
jgi:hypothetical protein